MLRCLSRASIATLRILPLLLLALPLSGQNRIGTGAAQQLYAQYCASCHGQDMEGGLGGSLIDDVWKHGSTDADLTRSIKDGLPELGMAAFGETLTDEQIRSLVILIREQYEIAGKDVLLARHTPRAGTFTSELHNFRLEPVVEADGILWSMAFLPDGSFLTAQRDGPLWHFRDGSLHRIEGTPRVWQHGQGGLMEVALHPDYAANGWIYLGYSENVGARERGQTAGMTCIVRGRLRDGRWVDQESVFHVPPEFHTNAGVHFGTRFVFQDGFLFFSIGDRGRMEMAQDLTRPNGKIHRLHDDGRIPADNPFVAEPGAFASIWSYGHRNPQGLDAHPVTGELWATEHGPRGGDETNRIRRGLNYGWPRVTYGMNYNGTPITSQTAAPGLEQPALYWTPSIAVCGIDFYEGTRFPRWQHHLFVTGLASEELHRLVIEDNQVVLDEIVLKGQGRLRDVHSGPDGFLYLLTESGTNRQGAIYRLVPAP